MRRRAVDGVPNRESRLIMWPEMEVGDLQLWREGREVEKGEK